MATQYKTVTVNLKTYKLLEKYARKYKTSKANMIEVLTENAVESDLSEKNNSLENIYTQLDKIRFSDDFDALKLDVSEAYL